MLIGLKSTVLISTGQLCQNCEHYSPMTKHYISNQQPMASNTELASWIYCKHHVMLHIIAVKITDDVSSVYRTNGG